MRIFLAFIATLMFCGPVWATESEGALRFYDKELDQFSEAPGIASDIHVDIEGTISRTTVTQYFLNNTAEWQEGIYTYPLPDKAAVDSLTMMVGNKRIIGFVHEKEQARKIYEQAKQQGKAAGLVEQHRPNIFKTKVANIPPQSMIAVEIKYQADVALDDYVFGLRLPMAITPRYDEFKQEELITLVSNAGQSWAHKVVDRLGLTGFAGGNNPYHLSITLNPGFAAKNIKSASHSLTIDEENGVYGIVTKKRILPGEKDFVLSWEPEHKDRILTSYHYEELDGDVYAHLLILPPQKPDDIKGPVPARQITYIIDTSGSMAGPSIRQAREALVSALKDLDDKDYFNIIEFNSFHKKFFAAPMAGTAENIESAVRLVRELEADGGTRMMPALQEAFKEKDLPGKLRQIVFITDGAIGYEGNVTELVKSHNAARFYVVGIGSAPNAYLMRSIAQAGRGTFTFIGKIDEVGEKMSSLFRKMKSPALTDLEIIKTDGQTLEIIPGKLPDLMAGEPVSIVLKSDNLLKHIDIRGMKAGKPWTLRAELAEPHPSEGISKIYARQKIADLSFANPRGQEIAIRQQIVTLGIQHQIISKYTSLVAVDEEVIRPAGEKLVSVRHDPNLPAGWQEGRIEAREASRLYGEMLEKQKAADPENEQTQTLELPQTATGYELSLLAGLLILFSSLLLWRRSSYAKA